MRLTSHIYAFQGFPGRLLFTGRQTNGHQFLVGPIPPVVVALEFDPQGRLFAAHDHALEEVADRASLEESVRRYFDSYKAVPSVIRIVRPAQDNPDDPLVRIRHEHGITISIDDYPLGLEDPEGYEVVDQDPEEYSAERERWRTSGCYVLNWGGDELYIDGEGNVVST